MVCVHQLPVTQKLNTCYLTLVFQPLPIKAHLFFMLVTSQIYETEVLCEIYGPLKSAVLFL